MLDAAAVRQMIMTAFESAKYPGDDMIVPAGRVGRESREVAASFQGRKWADLTPQLVFERKDALAFLSSVAFRYYLPAYLIACIDARSEVDTAWDGTIFHLTPPNPIDAFFLERATGFEVPQARAILRFLELQYENEKDAWGNKRPPEDFEQAIRFWDSAVIG